MTRELIPGLMKALKMGAQTHSIADVVDMIDKGDAQLHGCEDAVIITQVYDEPQAKVLHFWLATGELEPVIELSHRVTAWGKEIGCTRATLAGRKGWEKVLAADGWRPLLTVMGRSI